MQSKNTLLIFTILITISIAGIYYNFVNKTNEPVDACDLSSEKCTFVNKNGEISINFLSKIITEEEILLSIELPEGIQLNNAWIEGVNMYMGKTPIIEQNDVFVTFLGSCNLAKMQWRLNLSVEDENGQVENYSAVFFTTLDE
ncbi:hypothetical protein [Glaciecola sp.]|jgi:hypothetical protein|uniref:hypothetical protein n=1 Tax=Glaciecola sp. MF2-115 TaxID=3384827 RepID=UPI0016CE07EB|mmetsp:Transcript_32128/g.102322  ORF Transcript_32128/g.102322 Transcript_32128/m.102322 type:complete len:143 (+) Transcript_32128:81-509(+)